jgi:hypothetical protein
VDDHQQIPAVVCLFVSPEFFWLFPLLLGAVVVELGRKGGKGLDWIITTAVRFEDFAFASRQIQIDYGLCIWIVSFYA